MHDPSSGRAESELGLQGLLAGWESHVATLAKGMAYPPTPDLVVLRGAHSQDRRHAPALRPAWVGALLIVAVVLALLAVPEVRAAVVRVFQLGVVRIFVTEPSSEATEPPASEPLGQETPEAQGPVVQAPVTATPFIGPPPTALAGAAEAGVDARPTGEATVPPALGRLAGQTTLAEARELVPFPIVLPAYPPGLGEPDYIFVQKHAAPVLILAWSDPDAEGGVGLSLWMFLHGSAIDKIEPELVAETTVGGERALWTQGDHVLLMRNGDMAARRLVLGNTLIWERENITFRLETFLPLDEAVKVAESVR